MSVDDTSGPAAADEATSHREAAEGTRVAAEPALSAANPDLGHGRRRQQRRRKARPNHRQVKGGRKLWKLIPVAIIGFILVCAALALVAVLLSRSSLQNGVTEMSMAIGEVHQADRSAAVKDLSLASADFAGAHSVLTAWWTKPAELVPVVSQQLNALRAVAGAGGEVCSAGIRVNDGLTSGSLPRGPALIRMLRRLESSLTTAGSSLAKAEAQMSGARSPLLLPSISGRLDEAVTKVSAAVHDDHVAVAGIAAGVQFLGGDGPRTYFLAVETEAESRASGGIIGNYGIVTANNGTLRLSRFGSTTALESKGDLATRKLIAPADYVTRYSSFEPAAYWANVPMSPDFPTVAEVIEGLYPQEGGSTLDGVISVDPFALADLLQATGPVVVKSWPQPITAENAAPILFHDQYDVLTGTTRTNFLGDVAKTVWNRFTDGRLPDLQDLIQDLSPAISHKDLLLASTTSATERLLREIGAAGAFSPPANSDFFALTTQNNVANKIDWYLRRSVNYQVSYTPRTGAIVATVTVILHNTAPTSGQAPYVIGYSGQYGKTPGENRCFLTIYTPWAFESATVNAHQLLLSQNRELGVWADSATVSIAPGGTTTVTAELAGSLRPGSAYRLVISPQPMINPDEVQVGVHLPSGNRFSDPSAGLSLSHQGRQAVARFELQTNTSLAASVGK